MPSRKRRCWVTIVKPARAVVPFPATRELGSTGLAASSAALTFSIFDNVPKRTNKQAIKARMIAILRDTNAVYFVFLI
jgi:hypothetical protein